MLTIRDSIKYKEENIGYWKDPGCDNNKQSTVDLTAQAGAALQNDGSYNADSGAEPIIRPSSPFSKSAFQRMVEKKQTKQAIPPVKKPTFPPRPGEKTTCQPSTSVSPLTDTETSTSAPSTFPIIDTQSMGTQLIKRTVTFLEPDATIPSLAADANAASPPSGINDVPLATRGQGGLPPSRRCDLEALSGRMGRRETCVINAAIMASSWPHKGSGGKKYNKPIVVDIDLPVWADSASRNY